MEAVKTIASEKLCGIHGADRMEMESPTPLNSSGKVDRKRRPHPTFSAGLRVAPLGAVEGGGLGDRFRLLHVERVIFEVVLFALTATCRSVGLGDAGVGLIALSPREDLRAPYGSRHRTGDDRRKRTAAAASRTGWRRYPAIPLPPTVSMMVGQSSEPEFRRLQPVGRPHHTRWAGRRSTRRSAQVVVDHHPMLTAQLELALGQVWS